VVLKVCISLVNKKTTNAVTFQCIDARHSPTCFGTLKCHNQGVNHDPAEMCAQCLEIRDGWKLYIVAGGVIGRTATLYSFHPSLISTTWGTHLSRIMIDSPDYGTLKCRNV
jgi:hypothetical protein